MVSAGAASRGAATPDIARHPMVMVALAIVAVMLGVSAPNLLDPMIRFDDYPALFADPAGYWDKTRDEGRWFNYLWHLRGTTTPAWLNFALYQVLWALFAASLAIVALRGTGQRVWFTVVLALFVIVAPSATMIALWFNTLLPGLAVVTLFAGLSLIVSWRMLLVLLVPFTVVGFMAYTTYPLLLLAITLVRAPRRSVLGVVGILALFTTSFVLAVLCVYGLNLQYHGIFGVPVAEWRAATPGTNWASLMGNWPLVAQSFADFLNRSSFDFVPMVYLHLGLLVMATVVLARRAPLDALYLHAGLVTGLTLVVVQVLKVGVITPPRAFIFAWVFYGLLVVRAAQLLTFEAGVAGRLVRNAVLLVVGSYLLQTFVQYGVYRDWQAETRSLAEHVRTIEGPMVIEGDATTLSSARAAFVQDTLALSFRLQQLTGKKVPVCEAGPCCPVDGECPTVLRVATDGPVPRLVIE